jgi:AraC-like DNA-binding protein
MTTRSSPSRPPKANPDAADAWRRSVMASIAAPLFAEAMFDCVPDVVFSVKDREGRYVCISKTCVERCGLADRSEAIGRTAHDLFPKHMADRYVQQDAWLFRTGKPIIDNLDLTLYPDRSPGWCITTKFPQYSARGELVALACISKDLVDPGRSSVVDERFAETIDYIQENYALPLRIPVLARMAGLSAGQFERRMKSIFHISAVHFLIKTRIHQASLALANEDRSIADIALSCGFCDQSALSRQFKQLTGLTPREYRMMMRGGAPAGSERGLVAT